MSFSVENEKNAELDGYLKTVHAGIADRIGQGVLHQEYSPDYKLPPLTAFDRQKGAVFKAFQVLSRYDSTERLQQKPKLIFLPPSSLVDTRDEASMRFLERFSGLTVVDPDHLVQGVADDWELAVVQGDWSESMAHKDFEPDKGEVLPSYLQHMTHLFPLGYVALGGDVDREERHCTYLLDANGNAAYGTYRHSSPGIHTHQRISGEHYDGSFEPAQLIISKARPQKKHTWMGTHPRLVDFPLRQRLTFRAGQAS